MSTSTSNLQLEMYKLEFPIRKFNVTIVYQLNLAVSTQPTKNKIVAAVGSDQTKR